MNREENSRVWLTRSTTTKKAGVKKMPNNVTPSIPLNTAVLMRPENTIYVVAQTKQADLFDDAKAEVSFYMRKSRGLKPSDPNTFGVEAIEAAIAQVGRVLSLVTVFLTPPSLSVLEQRLRKRGTDTAPRCGRPPARMAQSPSCRRALPSSSSSVWS
jgi:hypothetical protein